MNFANNRDISIIKLDQEKVLIITCDSLGGIGSKPKDKLKLSNKLVGKFTVGVALMELLATGAEPIAVVDTLSVELEPTGYEIIAGIKEELAKIGLTGLLNGSTEENIPTVQTGLGVTVIGLADYNQLKLFSSKSNDLIVALGLPKVGSEVLKDMDQIADLELILNLLKLDYIHEILPVGSKGIFYEAQVLANGNDLNLELIDSKLDLEKSAGPATVLLVTIAEDNLIQLKKVTAKPINVIGRLYKI